MVVLMYLYQEEELREDLTTETIAIMNKYFWYLPQENMLALIYPRWDNHYSELFRIGYYLDICSIEQLEAKERFPEIHIPIPPKNAYIDYSIAEFILKTIPTPLKPFIEIFQISFYPLGEYDPCCKSISKEFSQRKTCIDSYGFFIRKTAVYENNLLPKIIEVKKNIEKFVGGYFLPQVGRFERESIQFSLDEEGISYIQGFEIDIGEARKIEISDSLLEVFHHLKVPVVENLLIDNMIEQLEPIESQKIDLLRKELLQKSRTLNCLTGRNIHYLRAYVLFNLLYQKDLLFDDVFLEISNIYQHYLALPSEKRRLDEPRANWLWGSLLGIDSYIDDWHTGSTYRSQLIDRYSKMKENPQQFKKHQERYLEVRVRSNYLLKPKNRENIIQEQVYAILEDLFKQLILSPPLKLEEFKAIRQITFEEMHQINSLRDLFTRTSFSFEKISPHRHFPTPREDLDQLCNYECYLLLYLISNGSSDPYPSFSFLTTQSLEYEMNTPITFRYPFCLIPFSTLMQLTLAGKLLLYECNWERSLWHLIENKIVPTDWIQLTHTCSSCFSTEPIDQDQQCKGIIKNGNFILDCYFHQCTRCEQAVWVIESDEYKVGDILAENSNQTIRLLHNIAQTPIHTWQNTNTDFEDLMNGASFIIRQLTKKALLLKRVDDIPDGNAAEPTCYFVKLTGGDHWVIEDQKYRVGLKTNPLPINYIADSKSCLRQLKNVAQVPVITPNNTDAEIQAFLDGESFAGISYSTYIRIYPWQGVERR